MAEETKKTTDKTKIDKALQKEREKQKAAIEKERIKQKEREKALLDKAIDKEREKQKEAQKKAIEKALEKEREKIREQILAGKDPFASSKPVKKLFLDKAKDILENPELEDEDIEEEEKIEEVGERKSLEDILKEKENNKDEEAPKEEEHLNHVEVLRKKREAQMKLNEELLKDKDDKDADIKAKLLAKANESLELAANVDTKEEDDELARRISELEEDNARLASTVESLGEELKNKDALINQQDSELKDKIEQITILSNSIVSEEPVVVEEKKDEQLVEDETIVEIKEQGDILIRIRLLNERIAEKNAQIKLVEDELNRLNEHDIFEKEFTEQIKKVRTQRQDVVKQANKELEDLAGMIRSNEEKLNKKIEAYNDKDVEIKAYDKECSEKKMNYTEKEEAMKKRSRIIAEFDALAIELESLKENYSKLVERYKERLRKAELNVDNLNKLETELIQLYLKKLRDQKSSENEDYINQKEERSALLNELNQLNTRYENMKDEENEERNVVDTTAINEQLEELKTRLASVEGKLVLLITRRDERETIEKALRVNDKEVKAYLAAFNEKEIVNFEINGNQKKLDKVIEDLKTCSPEESSKLQAYASRYEMLVDDNKAKLQYLESTITKYDNSEKVIFYKQLLRSIAELNNSEEPLKAQSRELRNKINTIENKPKAE